MLIDMFYPFVPKEAAEAAYDTLRTRWIGEGPKVKQFESEFAKFFDVQYPVSVNSGTAALESAYELLNLQSDDEVITTPLTCLATNLALLRRGVKIIWADIDPKTLCIDPKDVEKKLTEKTKAVVQVHLGGIQADVKNLPVPIISDAAQALGVFVGDYTVCSFQAIKQITTADGGMLICPNEEIQRKAKLLRWFGIDREKKITNSWQAYKLRKMTFDVELPGTKRQMNDLAAAMGLVGLQYYDRIIAHRKKLFEQYKQQLSGVSGITVVDGKKNTYWLMTVLVNRRDDLIQKLFEADIDTNLVQIRNDIYRVFGGKRAELPKLNSIEFKYVSLPLGMHITEDQVGFICDTIKQGW